MLPWQFTLQRYFQELHSFSQRPEQHLVNCMWRQLEMGGANIPVSCGYSLSSTDTCSAHWGGPSVTSTNLAISTSLALPGKAGTSPKAILALSRGCCGWPGWADSQDKWWVPDCNAFPSGNSLSTQSKTGEKLGVGLGWLGFWVVFWFFWVFLTHRIGWNL